MRPIQFMVISIIISMSYISNPFTSTNLSKSIFHAGRKTFSAHQIRNSTVNATPSEWNCNGNLPYYRIQRTELQAISLKLKTKWMNLNKRFLWCFIIIAWLYTKGNESMHEIYTQQKIINGALTSARNLCGWLFECVCVLSEHKGLLAFIYHYQRVNFTSNL